MSDNDHEHRAYHWASVDQVRELTRQISELKQQVREITVLLSFYGVEAP